MDFTSFWELFKELMTISTGIVATTFSFYFAWQRIGKSVRASYSLKFEILSDTRLNNIIISNFKNKPIEIYSIHATINSKYFLEVEKFDSPFILKPLETSKIETSPLSKWDCNNEDIDVGKLLTSGNIQLYITTNTSIIKCKTLKHESALFSKKFKGLKHIEKYTAKYNGIVYTDDVVFVIDYLDNNKQKTVFVFESGVMSASILGYNALSKDLLVNKDNIKKHFKEKGLNIHIKESDGKFRFK